jgi:polysaccharide biosynthesis protein PslH
MRVWSILKCLKSEGCQTDLICFGNPTEAHAHRTELASVCRSVQVIPHSSITLSGRINYTQRLWLLFSRYPYSAACSRSQEMTECILESLKEADAILFEETNLLTNLPSRSRLPVIVDHHNVEHVVLRRYVGHASDWFRAAYAFVEALKVRRWEKFACSLASGVMVCSDHDAAAFLELSPTVPSAVAPNVIDTNDYAPLSNDDGRTLLYAGGMDWYPNRDAVIYFIDNILPHIRQSVPGVTFVVAGRNPSKEFQKRFSDVPDVVFTGTVHDMRSELAKATVCVVPLRIGSGTRFKILEAAAMGKAIVSTRIGAEGLDFTDGSEIVLADDPSAFARSVDQLLQNNERRRLMGAAARRRVETCYNLPVLSRVLREALGLASVDSFERLGEPLTDSH